jgi:hypothetical protein
LVTPETDAHVTHNDSVVKHQRAGFLAERP